MLSLNHVICKIKHGRKKFKAKKIKTSHGKNINYRNISKDFNKIKNRKIEVYNKIQQVIRIDE